MWALINPNDDTIERIFPRPTPFRMHDINHPASFFKDAVALVEHNILPVRRIQIGNPGDTVGWTASSQYVVELAHVRDEVTWVEDEDGQAQRDARDVVLAERQAKALFIRRHANLHTFLQFKGYVSEHEMTAADVLEFHADWRDLGEDGQP